VGDRAAIEADIESLQLGEIIHIDADGAPAGEWSPILPVSIRE